MAWDIFYDPMMVGIMLGILLFFAAIGAQTVGRFLADIFFPDEEVES